MRLTSGELSERFVLAAEAMYHCAAVPSDWPRALQAIADCFDDIGTVLIWRRDDGSCGTIVSPALKAAQDDYAKRWWQHDIRAARSHDHGFRVFAGAITDRHVASEQEFAAHPIYMEFLATYGLKWFAAVQVSPEPRISVAISVQRAKGKPEFSDADLSLLTRLGRTPSTRCA